MKKLGALVVLVVALVLGLGASSFALADGRHGGHGSSHKHFVSRRVGGTRVFVGVVVGQAFVYPVYNYPPPFYYPPVVYTPPPVFVQEPPVFVQQPQPAPAPSLQAEVYWYYCPSAKGYYPNVQHCPEPWVKVPPRAQ